MSLGKPHRTFLYIAACTANIIAFVCGTVFGWTSPVIPHLQNLTSSPLDHIITVSEEGWIGGFVPLASIVGPIGGGMLANTIGRKKTLLTIALPFLLAFLINVFATTMYMFYISRFLCGLGVGVTFTILPMYIAEISDDEVRSSLGSVMQLFTGMGMLFSYVLGPYLSIRTFNIVLMLPSIIYLVLFATFIPDSVYYLLQNGKYEQALGALTKLRGRDKVFIQKELTTLKEDQQREDQENKGSLSLILNSKVLRKALFISFSLLAFQQLSGINVVLYYTQNIFTDAGVTLAPEICTIIFGIIQIVASAGSIIVVEKSGKKILLILSAFGMTIAQGTLACYFLLKDDLNINVSPISWVPIVSLIVYTITYCLGFGCIPWTIMSELFPGNVKPIASSATSSFCWTICFFITNYFGTVTEVIGKSGTFGFFSIASLIAVIFTFKFVPETAGKSLSEIQFILSRGDRTIDDRDGNENC